MTCHFKCKCVEPIVQEYKSKSQKSISILLSDIWTPLCILFLRNISMHTCKKKKNLFPSSRISIILIVLLLHCCTWAGLRISLLRFLWENITLQSWHASFYHPSILSRTVHAVVSWSSFLTAHTLSFRQMNHTGRDAIFSCSLPQNSKKPFLNAVLLFLTMLSAKVASFECKTRRKETLGRLIQLELPKYSPGKVTRLGQIFSNY